MKKINRNIYGAMLFCAMANQSHGLQNNSYCSPYNSLRVMAPNFYPKPNNRGNFRQQAHRPQQYGQLPPLSQGQYQNQGSKNDPYNPSGAMVPNFYPQTNVADGNNFWQPNYPQQQVSKSLYGQLPPLSQGQYQNQGSKNDPYNPSGAMVPNFYPQTNAAGGNFRQPNYPQRQVGQSLYGQLPSLSQVQYQNQGSKNDPYNPSVAMASNFYPQTNAKDRYTPNGAYLPHDLQPIDDSLRNFPSIYRPLKIELTEREKAILGGVGNFYGFLCGIYNKTSGKEYNSLTSAHTYLRDAQKEHLGKGGYSLLKALDTLIAVAVQELFSNPNIQVRNKIKQFLSYTMKSLMPEMPRNDSAQAYLSSIARNMSLAGFNFAI